jgi:hypothetical protein
LLQHRIVPVFATRRALYLAGRSEKTREQNEEETVVQIF